MERSKYSGRDRALIYAEVGLWYDALEAISTVYRGNPKDTSILEDRIWLLERSRRNDDLSSVSFMFPKKYIHQFQQKAFFQLVAIACLGLLMATIWHVNQTILASSVPSIPLASQEYAMSATQPLSDSELQTALRQLSGWSIEAEITTPSVPVPIFCGSFWFHVQPGISS